MINREMNDFRSEKEEEILEILDDDKAVMMVAGCGCGKSYFVGNVLMKRYNTLNVNYLNVLNMQNFSDSYIPTRREVENFKGDRSITINIQQLEHIDDKALDKLELIVIDEIQNNWFSATYRRCVGDQTLVYLRKLREKGKKILIMTGTPLLGTFLAKELDIETIKITKINLTEKDKYEFSFIQGLNFSNLTEEVLYQTRQGKTVIIMSNLHRKEIRKRLNEAKILFRDIQSSDKVIEDTATAFMIKEQKLPEDVDVFLSTCLLCGGVNLTEEKKDKEVVYLTFLEDIGTPHELIQLVGRSRNQSKVAIIGYRDEADFNKNYTHTLYTNQKEHLLKSETVREMEQLLGDNLNSGKDWFQYLRKFSNAKIYLEEEDEEAAPINKIETEKTNWSLFCKKVKESREDFSTSFSNYYRVKAETGNNLEIIKNPSGGNSKFIYVDNIMKAKRILKALDLGFPVENYNEAQINRLLDIIYICKAFVYLSENGDNEALRKDILRNSFSLYSETFREPLAELFKVTRYKNGREEEIKDWRKSARVALPFYILQNYRETTVALIRKLSLAYLYRYSLELGGFEIDGSKFLDIPKIMTAFINNFEKEDKIVANEIEKKKEAEIKAKVAGGSKGGKATKNNKKIKVISENNKRLKGLLNTEYSSVNEASEKLGINRSTIFRMIKKGLLEEV